ncbi:MAG: copper resistance protein NlpE N-terminal domain-containing protein, partial [Anaerolineae bacterium]|nr:copper resistance protein NlpE N-terminal domain-containing protein [Anaerolineae bacterium]
MKIKIASLLALALVLGLGAVLSAQPLPVQAQTAEGEEYIVQADDWLSKIADKFYGDVLAYPAIVEATNAKAAEDDSFATITNPDVIEVGQKLFIPPAAEAVAAAPAPAPAADVAGIYKVMLPGASSPGLDITLYLNVDNSMRQVSDYLNGEAPVVEVGTWQAAG